MGAEAVEMIHAFEKAGLGKAPFRYVGIYELPSPALAAQNPSGYNAALAMMPRGYRCGSCNYCGRAIMINCLIKSSDGKCFAVGSECVLKVGGAGMVKLMRKSKEFRKHAAEARRRAEERVKEAWAEIWANPENVEKLSSFSISRFGGQEEPWSVFAKRVWEMCGASGRRRYLKQARELLAHGNKKEAS